jgi:hypothetical protein
MPHVDCEDFVATLLALLHRLPFFQKCGIEHGKVGV